MYLLRLQKDEKIKEHEKIRRLEEILGNAQEVVGVKENKVEMLTDEVLSCKCENEITEGELENRKEEIEELKMKCNANEEAVCNNKKEQINKICD